MKLYSYYRSSASYRVRIALALKEIRYDAIPVNLLKGEQKLGDYAKLNPQKKIPALLDGPHLLTQSLAIIEYLEETHPYPPLLPDDAAERARVRALSLAIACEIAPICNSGPLNYLTTEMGVSEDNKLRWYQHWMKEGLSALEEMVKSSKYTGTFCHGESPTMADCCLVPQLFNARRYQCDLSAYPTLMRIDEACAKLPAFGNAHPDKQADAV